MKLTNDTIITSESAIFNSTFLWVVMFSFLVAVVFSAFVLNLHSKLKISKKFTKMYFILVGVAVLTVRIIIDINILIHSNDYVSSSSTSIDSYKMWTPTNVFIYLTAIWMIIGKREWFNIFAPLTIFTNLNRITTSNDQGVMDIVLSVIFVIVVIGAVVQLENKLTINKFIFFTVAQIFILFFSVEFFAIKNVLKGNVQKLPSLSWFIQVSSFVFVYSLVLKFNYWRTNLKHQQTFINSFDFDVTKEIKKEVTEIDEIRFKKIKQLKIIELHEIEFIDYIIQILSTTIKRFKLIFDQSKISEQRTYTILHGARYPSF